MSNKSLAGHSAALITILIWGTTFVSTKVLLVDFGPIEILFFRFVIGFFALLIVCPRRLKKTGRKQELFFAAAGLCGICLYYLLENIALTFTQASNVGVIISVAPFFTALLTWFILRSQGRPSGWFFAGFVVAMVGICLISFGGSHLEVNPAGDLLALAAAMMWAIYSVFIKKIGEFGHNTILITRRVFFYGIVWMLPTLLISDFQLDLSRFTSTVNLLNMLFLGLGASALCFVTWNYAVKVLGAVKTSVYIYLVPVVTTVTSVIILHEIITGAAIVGIILTLTGLFLSEANRLKRKNHTQT